MRPVMIFFHETMAWHKRQHFMFLEDIIWFLEGIFLNDFYFSSTPYLKDRTSRDPRRCSSVHAKGIGLGILFLSYVADISQDVHTLALLVIVVWPAPDSDQSSFDCNQSVSHLRPIFMAIRFAYLGKGNRDIVLWFPFLEEVLKPLMRRFGPALCV